MTKPLKLVLACSVVANVVFALAVASGVFSSAQKPPPQATASAASGKSPAASKLSPETAMALKALLIDADPVALRDQLNALGLPREFVRTIVTARIWKNFNEQQSEYNRARREAQNQRPYWQRNNETAEERARTRAHYAGLRETRQALEEETRRVLGAGENFDYAQSRMSFLAPGKVAQRQSIDRDYNDLRSQIYDEMSSFPMPGDQEKLKLLDEEKQKDVNALLTHEEREMNELRNSSTASRVQSTYRGVNLSEEEYKTIYALQKSIDEKYGFGYASAYDNEDEPSARIEKYRERQGMQKDVDAQIKDIIGTERWAEYELNKRADYRTLQAAAQRFNLSNEVVAQTYQVRDSTAAEAKRISDDATLSAAQRNAAYASLAEQASNQIRATLGDEVGTVYINKSLPWLKNLPKGGRVQLDNVGNVRVTPATTTRPSR